MGVLGKVPARFFPALSAWGVPATARPPTTSLDFLVPTLRRINGLDLVAEEFFLPKCVGGADYRAPANTKLLFSAPTVGRKNEKLGPVHNFFAKYSLSAWGMPTTAHPRTLFWSSGGRTRGRIPRGTLDPRNFFRPKCARWGPLC